MRHKVIRRLAVAQCCGEGQHAVYRKAGADAQGGVDVDLIRVRLQHMRQRGQAVHRHPRAVGAAFAGGAVAGGGGF